MSHATPLTESSVRHVDIYRVAAANDDLPLLFTDLDNESQARHVDEYRHAIAHADA